VRERGAKFGAPMEESRRWKGGENYSGNGGSITLAGAGRV